MKVQAPAKINLALDVIGRRADGYHDVRMVMQSIHLCDELEFEVVDNGDSGDGSFHPRVHLWLQYSLRGSKEPSPLSAPVPADDRNLAVRAAKLLMEEFHIRETLSIRLTKRIPVAAGLAGGSTDAAATLIAVNRLFDLGLSRAELAWRGAKLGADIPFCVLGGTALAEGIGERLSVLPDMPPCHILIGKPGIAVSTGFVYTNLHLETISSRPDIDGMIDAIQTRNFSGVAAKLGNVLESVTCPLHPEIEAIKAFMMDHGAAGALMSGSGPTVFGLFEEEAAAERARGQLEQSGLVETALVAVPRKREEES